MSSARPGVIVLTSEQARAMIGAPPTGDVSLAQMADGSIIVVHPEVQPHFLRLRPDGGWDIATASPNLMLDVYLVPGDSGENPKIATAKSSE